MAFNLVLNATAVKIATYNQKHNLFSKDRQQHKKLRVL